MIKLEHIAALSLAAGSFLLPAPSSAALQTIAGTDFDLVYDDTKLGLFGAPSLVGDNLFFSPNNFKAESINGLGIQQTSSTVSDLRLIAHPGFNFGELSLFESGDYLLSGDGSTVQVRGQLRAFDPANAAQTQTTNNLAVLPSTPLTINDGTNHDWLATANITNATTPLFPAASGWLSNSSSAYVTIENILTAYTPAGGTGPQDAFIEKKFSGIQLSVISAVPEPSAIVMACAGLIVAGGLGRRRQR